MKINHLTRSFLAIAVLLSLSTRADDAAKSPKSWSIKADYIEACSCSLFCSCYFYTQPEGGEKCDFNNAVRIISGHVGNTKVDGLKCWLSGNLGGDFTKGLKAAVLTFEPSTTDAQKDAIKFLMGKVYPAKWESFETDTAPITWEKKGMSGYAKLGDKAEVKLEGVTGADGKPVVIQNLRYWGAQKNNGFHLAKSEHHYKGFGHDYSFKDRNGFFITIEASGTAE